MDKSKFTLIGNHLADFEALLQAATEQLQVPVDKAQQHTLLLYLDKLLFWNKAYNLTAIKQPHEALIKHVIDCLAIIPHLKPGTLLDIGTGAGLPGVIVAICQPERQITVLDSNQKKIRFIKQLVSELTLKNITPVASRIEHFNPPEADKFAVVTSRAFASLSDFVAASTPRLAKGGCLQAMKGLPPESSEMDALLPQWHITTIALSVPQLNETRHLIELTKKTQAV